MEGVIKTLTDKGYGFIAVEGEEKDLFFHSNAIAKDENGNPLFVFDDLKEGDKVSFDKADSEKGPNAVNVTLIIE